jgi:hypothetical protein
VSFYSPQSGGDIVARAEAQSKEAELEQKAARYSQLHSDDEPRTDTAGGFRSALKRLLRRSS